MRRSERRVARRNFCVLSQIGYLLISLGVLTLLFGAYQLWFTDTVQKNTQSELVAEVRKYLPPPAPHVVGSSTPLPASADLGEGHWVGVISIPKINLQQVIVDGTSVNDLRLGPGHYLGTPLPGEAGNVAIAGHRTTWGRPFRNLDKLVTGDQIIITTPRADVMYRVTRIFVVKPDDLSVIAPTSGNMLTLTTCNPPYSAVQRLVVRARLVTVGKLHRDKPTVTISKVIKHVVPRHTWWPTLWWSIATLALYIATLKALATKWHRYLVISVASCLAVPLLLGLFGALSWQMPAGY